MRTALALVVAAGLPCLASGATIVSQTPGTGTPRWSQLWQDPTPAGNDLDGDSVCWEDFTLSAPTVIDHLEWWGAGACQLGFQIEFWRQDPGTIAYQPLGVFYYGSNPPTAFPEATFRTTSYTTSPGPNGTTHFSLDLTSPVSLAANDPANPRWFVSIIGLTSQAYVTWNWAQGNGGSTRSYQFIRGEGPQFRQLPEGRALVISGTGPCYANCDASVSAPILNVADFTCFLQRYASGDAYANCDASTASPVLNVADFTCFLQKYAAGCL